jgi:hypothetical protein
MRVKPVGKASIFSASIIASSVARLTPKRTAASPSDSTNSDRSDGCRVSATGAGAGVTFALGFGGAA